MKIGISELYTGLDGRDGHWMLDSARLIEELGFNSLWMPERMMFFPQYESTHPYSAQGEVLALRWNFDALVALAAISVATRQIRLGTYVALPGLREPIVTARAVGTLDQVSNGRFDFGVGVSWMKEEHVAMRVPWETRGARVTEYLRAMKHIWTTELSEFHGRFVDFPAAYIGPKPVQKPHPPIVIGGNSPAAIQRVVDVGNRWLGYGLSLAEVEQFIVGLHAALRAAGRDPKEVVLSVGRRFADADGPRKSGTVDAAAWDEARRYVEACEELGIQEVVFSTRMPYEGYERHMRNFAEAMGVGS
jgi:probable F420-dependent oxidoreductase